MFFLCAHSGLQNCEFFWFVTCFCAIDQNQNPGQCCWKLEGLGQLGSWCSQEKAEIALVRRCCSGIPFSFATLPWFCRDKCQRELKLIQFHCPLAENVLGTNFRVGSEGQMSARAKISKISLPFSWKCVFFKFQGRIWGTNVNESQN